VAPHAAAPPEPAVAAAVVDEAAPPEPAVAAVVVDAAVAAARDAEANTDSPSHLVRNGRESEDVRFLMLIALGGDPVRTWESRRSLRIWHAAEIGMEEAEPTYRTGSPLPRFVPHRSLPRSEGIQGCCQSLLSD
jgi:hypothetical protein